MSPADVPYRDFYYPLNVFMHVLSHEEGGVAYLHYGLFERPDESIAAAQEHSTELLLEHLPKPPARILEVGAGLGTTLARLARLGYDAIGITPDEKQIGIVRARHGHDVHVEQIAFENYSSGPFDIVIFQESSQYIDSQALFAKAAEITGDVIVIDEFDIGSGDALHRLDSFVDAAARNGFRTVEEIDLSTRAAPTIDYFMKRLPRYRAALVSDLGLTHKQVDDLLASGAKYRDSYASGAFVYRLIRFMKG